MHFLIFKSKRLSYDSSWCFMDMMQRSFEQLGAQVTVFELEEDIESQEKELLELCSMDFDGIFDVNSILPSVKNDEEYYLNCFDAPFYQLIVDHPMHVHPSLMVPLKNHIVLCLDREHKEYLERYYPHLQSVYFFPFAGISSGEEIIPIKERTFDILFPATYTPLDYYRQQMDCHGDYFCEMADEILREYRQGSIESIDVLFHRLSDSDESFFAMKLYKARFVDRYIRQWYREQVLRALLRQKITVDVVGFRWEMYQGEGREYLRIHEPCSYLQQLSMLGQSKMVLNVQPLFQDGPHDRVMNAMMNYSVSVTDTCRFLQEQFTQEKEIFLYDKNKPEEMAQWVKKQLQTPFALEKMVEQAYQKALSRHTWLHRVEGIYGRVAQRKNK